MLSPNQALKSTTTEIDDRAIRVMPKTAKVNRRHRWPFRLAAVALGLLPLLLFETALTILKLPRRPSALDPYVDLHHLRPLFEFNRSTGCYEIGSQRLHLFRPASFPATKVAGTYRVFALGGSTTQGEPFSTETAFPEWLKLNLQAQSPDTRFEVINCGGLSYASYRVLAILREVLAYEPDLIVIYTGQNEFLERRTYADWMPVNAQSNALARLKQLRTVQLVRTFFNEAAERSQAPSRTELAAEVDALLDYSGGLDEYRRDDPWREPVVDHFRWNVEQMIRECQQRSVPLVLVRPVSNLLDCPPFKFEIDSKLSADQQAEFARRWDNLREQRDANNQPISDAMAELDKLLALDPQHAGALYLKGRLLADQQDWESAKRYLIAARDADVCPLRAISPIADAVTELANRFDVPLLDAERLISDASDHQLPSTQWLIDHVHPTVEGHQLIGDALTELCIAERFIAPTNPNWKSDRKLLYEAHLQGLGEAYFHRGKQRLEGLLLWTQGRAKKSKAD